MHKVDDGDDGGAARFAAKSGATRDDISQLERLAGITPHAFDVGERDVGTSKRHAHRSLLGRAAIRRGGRRNVASRVGTRDRGRVEIRVTTQGTFG